MNEWVCGHKQECIPVGCLRTALCCTGVLCRGGGSLSKLRLRAVSMTIRYIWMPEPSINWRLISRIDFCHHRKFVSFSLRALLVSGFRPICVGCTCGNPYHLNIHCLLFIVKILCDSAWNSYIHEGWSRKLGHQIVRDKPCHRRSDFGRGAAR